jgi:hypothetical protein
VTETELLAMRGWLDLLFGFWLIKRFVIYSLEFSIRLRLTQFLVISFLLFVLQILGVWHWAEVIAAFKIIPVIWPILLFLLYLGYQNRLLTQNLEKAEFEVDWRREYQEVLIQELEGKGQQVPSPPEQ